MTQINPRYVSGYQRRPLGGFLFCLMLTLCYMLVNQVISIRSFLFKHPKQNESLQKLNMRYFLENFWNFLFNSKSQDLTNFISTIQA